MAPAADILSKQIICKEPGRYIGWPTIIRTRAGELIIAFSGDRDSPVYEAHAKTLSQEVRDRWKGHWTQRSTDSGLTWEEPVSFAIETSAVGADLLSDFRHPVIE